LNRTAPDDDAIPTFPPPSRHYRARPNALEWINEEFRGRTKTQASLPSHDAVLLLLFGLLRSGQIRLRAIDGWQEMRVV
jgi:transposase-like protein